MEKPFKIIIRNILRASLFAAFILAWPQNGFAHARMIRSTPESGQAVSSPQKIELWFNELLDGQFNTIVVYPVSEANQPKRVSFTRGEAKVDPADHTHLTIEIQALQPGAYYVEWRVLSLDGHSAPGRFRFQVSKQ